MSQPDSSKHSDSCETFLKQWVRACGPLAPLSDGDSGPGEAVGSGDWFDDRAAGRQIVAFRLIRRIGQGGMGVVWLAEQRPPLRRLVAVKFLKPEHHHRAIRFEIEQQSLAMLNHRHIAQIIDAGVASDGQPYFVMEYLDGIDLIAYGNRHGLGIAERLEIFIDVCQAVAYAHSRGVIHRDIKPSNMLVIDPADPGSVKGQAADWTTSNQFGPSGPSRPIVKLIDFGIAKIEPMGDLEGNELVAATGERILLGSLPWMSPEQAAAALGIDRSEQIDARTDVYSLGAVLYQLITDRTLLDETTLKSKSVAEVLKYICDSPPVQTIARSTDWYGQPNDRSGPLSGRSFAFTGYSRKELKWITWKALEKDPQRRYQTASELAADITRFLANQPVLARAPSWSYRLTKAIRRNRWVALWIALAAMTMIIGGVVSAVFWGRSVADRRLATTALNQSREMQGELDLLESVVQASLEPIFPGRPNVGVEDRDTETLAELENRLENGDLGFDRRCRLLTRVARIWFLYGNYDHATATLTRVVEEAPPHADSSLLLDAKALLGRSLIESGQADRGLAVLRASVGQVDLDASDMVATKRIELKLIYAEAAQKCGQLDIAFQEAVQCLDRLDQCVRDSHPSDTLSPMRLRLENVLALTCLQRGDIARANQYLSEPLGDSLDGLEINEVVRLQIMRDRMAIARRAQRGGDTSKQTRAWDALYQRSRKMLGPNHPLTLSLIIDRARLASHREEWQQSTKLLNEAVETATSSVGAGRAITVDLQHQLGVTLLRARRPDRAEPLLKKALALRQQLWGVDHPATIRTMRAWAVALRQTRRMKQAAEVLGQAWELRRDRLGPASGATVYLAGEASTAAYAVGNVEASRRILGVTLDACQRKWGERHVITAEARLNLARMMLKGGQFETARQHFDMILFWLRSPIGNIVNEAHLGRMEIAMADQDRDTARQGLADWQRWYRQNRLHQPYYVAVWNVFQSELLIEKGDYASALEQLETRRHRESESGGASTTAHRARLLRAVSLLGLGRTDEADRLLRQARPEQPDRHVCLALFHERTAQRIARLYQQQGETAKSRRWEQNAARFLERSERLRRRAAEKTNARPDS